MNNHALKIVNDYIQFSDRTMILQHANMNLSLFKSSSSKEKERIYSDLDLLVRVQDNFIYLVCVCDICDKSVANINIDYHFSN